MTLQEQLCTPDQGKQLVALGVSVTPVWYHVLGKNRGQNYTAFRRQDGTFIDPSNNAKYSEGYGWTLVPAFSVAEMNKMLPVYYYAFRKFNNPTLNEEWSCESRDGINCQNDTQAKCLAEMLIYLLEERAVTPEEINENFTQKIGS